MAVRTTQGWVANEATERIFSRVDMGAFVEDIDWDEAFRRYGSPEIPEYVRSSIHGIEGGYGVPSAASTWDAVVTEIFAEYVGDETSQRDMLTASVRGTPAVILDVACGTGESTLGWRRRFPGARISACDVSPYMLAVAERKLAGDDAISVQWANAERLPFPDASFDLVTASLLFHELPDDVSPLILREMRRVLAPGGEIAVMEPYDTKGRSLHPIPFPEPYLKEFLATDWDAAFEAAGFSGLVSRPYGEGWIRVATAS